MPGWFNAPTRFRRRVRRSFFYAADEFREILRRQQLRPDRGGRPFSLVTFWIHEKTDHEQKVQFFEKVCAARLRVTDQAGMLESRKIGIVLPYTPARDAWKVADDLRNLTSSRIPRLTCEVFEYPVRPSLEEGERVGTRPLQSPVLHSQLQSTWFSRANSCWKHVLDVTGAATGLVVFSPVMLAAALAIKLTSPGPILFCQQREGRYGKPFTMYKFRSMHAGADAMQAALRDHSEQDGPAFKMTDDPRVTPIGRLLRSTSIDELPQFWNVLRREMSLVGPRPLPLGEAASCDSWYRRRLEVAPGLTCIWQIHGRSRVSFDEWMRMDLQYIQSRSFFLDLKLLLQTVPAVLSRRGAK